MLGQHDRDAGFVGAARARIVAAALRREDGEQRVDRVDLLQQRRAAVQGPGFEIVEAGGQQQRQAALEYVDARIGVRQRRHHVAQLLAFGERQPAQRGKQLLHGRQAQRRRQRIGERLHAEHPRR